MSVYKEGYHIISTISKHSERIFDDAADYGAPVRNGDQLWCNASQLVDWYGVKGTRQESRYRTLALRGHYVIFTK
jgi:hypothetical protein